MDRGPGAGRQRIPIHFPAWDERSANHVWKEYVERNHALGGGLRTIPAGRLLNKNVHGMNPVSPISAGMIPADLALLRGLASIYEDCSYFEISKRRCESLDIMAGAARVCYALTRPAEELRKMGIRCRYMYSMGAFSKDLENVVALSGDSNTFDFASLGRTFDIIFINNGHGYYRIVNDTRKAFEFLAHESSVIVWHDYSFFPEQIRYEVLAGILDGTDPQYREQLFFVSQTKCAIFLRQSLLERIPPK